jgi:fused signal recognition particle receptor
MRSWFRFGRGKDEEKPGPQQQSEVAVAPLADVAVLEVPAAEAPPVPETPAVETPVLESPAAETPVLESPPAEEPRGGFLARLRQGLSRSTNRLSDGLAEIFVRRQLDEATLDELEELLIAADLGPATAGKLRQQFDQRRFGEVTLSQVKEALAEDVAAILTKVEKPLAIDPAIKPYVVLVVGVNGTGKTTTIGKLTAELTRAGKRVMLAAGDTFRAAAVEQLRIWGQRSNVPVVTGAQGSDAAALSFQALEQARREGADVLLIDTAGRLHNKANLMAELQKIVRVLKKLDPTAPHATVLTLDATTGQNALAQVETFRAMTDVTGLVVTKLDGTAKGGVLVALADKFGLPVHGIGVGEGIDDLQPFDAREFARSLTGAM